MYPCSNACAGIPHDQCYNIDCLFVQHATSIDIVLQSSEPDHLTW